MDQTIFFTKVRTDFGKRLTRKLIRSIRCFGGDMSGCPIWVFDLRQQGFSSQDFDDLEVKVIPLSVPEQIMNYVLGDKVYVCAQAEQMAPAGVQSLVWMDPTCLVVNPPVLYKLSARVEAAVRPVHIRNVGLRATYPLDDYWQKVYATVGSRDLEATVESFVDKQVIRAYYNTHTFAVNPASGLLQRWLEYFDQLVSDRDFQTGACQDELHQIFLHQAVFSALLTASISAERVRVLPPEYNYPYHLQMSIPVERRAKAINDLVTVAYEDCSLNPAEMTDIEVHEPLRSWLAN